MLEILVVFLGIAIYLYVLLGGADFGAGIIELITGKKGISTISKAIAPIWEANHIWIILVIVILFNGFPRVYTSISTYLHIPLLLALIGIIIRGCSFTFRYYDVVSERTSDYYTRFFRISSIVTPFFLGMITGTVISGRIPASTYGSFPEIYLKPWLNFFSVSTGMFTMILFAWLASVYLIGEKKVKEATNTNFVRIAYVLFILLIISGVLVFASAEMYQIHLVKKFFLSKISIVSVILATLIVPFLWYKISRKNPLWTRISAAAITFFILTGWFGIQFPVMINVVSPGENFTVYNSAAPEITINYLVYALFIGLVIILPAFVFLFKTFKFSQT
jgi:cytochrome bd ubiquinol oxidase subunit II